MSQSRSHNPFEDEDEDLQQYQQQQQHRDSLKCTKMRQGRSAPLVFSNNPFNDDDAVAVDRNLKQDFFDRVTNLRSPSVASEVSPLLPDDLSRGYQSSNGTTSPSNMSINRTRRRLTIPTKIFTGSPQGKKPSTPRRGRNNNNSSNNSNNSNINSNNNKNNIILKELASGNDHEQNIHMEYKFILLEDLGTAASWLILVLPYVAFLVSILVEYYTSISVSTMGPAGTALRMSCFLVTFGFIVYWARQMEIRCCCCFWYIFGLLRNAKNDDEEHQAKPVDLYWFENPWILFPERYYILPLLLSLLLVHEPVLIAINYIPTLGSVSKTRILHAVSDASAGAGVQGILLIYLCLIQGFRYHTSDRSKQRAERQRKALQLRQAVKFVDDDKHKHKEFISSPRVIENYYEEYGDIDGSAFTEHLRLPSDPFNSSSWADFLLPKIMLWLVGVLSCTMVAYTQHSHGKTVTISNINLTTNDTMYIVSSLIYGSTIALWTYLIIIALYVTGETLRREPFLGTRPAQLAYRILFAHSALAIVALVMSSIQYIRKLQGVLQGQSIVAIVKYGDVTFSGMFGRLLSVTVQVIITAFIFLPPHTMDFDEVGDDDDNNEHTELQILNKNKRDKRLVVHLAKHSKTWRIFPVPIQHIYNASSPFQDDMYQIYKDLCIDRNTQKRGLVSVGPYIPVFCAELACWLNECSWQAYYSPVGSPEMKHKDDFYGWMRLDTIGLQLEGYVHDERTNTQAYIATNSAPQVEGEEDSVIVIAFRGTSNTTNMQVDLRMRQVPLLDQITGIGNTPFRIFPDRFEVHDEDGWIWDTAQTKPVDQREHIKCVNCWTEVNPPCTPTHTTATLPHREERQRTPGGISKETVDILKAAPLARDTFPMVHEGFQDAYNEIRKQIFDLFLPVLQRQLAKSLRSQNNLDAAAKKEPLALPKIYCTGHSLGGSLAQLFALDLAANCELILQLQQPGTSEVRLQPPIGVYTYGQPRVGNRAFSRIYKQRVPHSFRVVNEGDAFTTIPNYFCCGGLYKHAGLEVILDGGMTGNVLVGPTVVETLFRFHKVRTNVAAHQMERYRECLECIFDPSQLLEYYIDHNVAYQELMADPHGFGGGVNSSDDNKTPGRCRDGGGLSTIGRNHSYGDFPEWMVTNRRGYGV